MEVDYWKLPHFRGSFLFLSVQPDQQLPHEPMQPSVHEEQEENLNKVSL